MDGSIVLPSTLSTPLATVDSWGSNHPQPTRDIMDAYLDIAEEVLRRVKRPLTALEILKTAYAMDIAPAHLRGRTQHKTLGARLSEDILKHREDGRFYRIRPGRFLLRELAEDAAIPSELRQPFLARRRRRALPRKQALAFPRSLLMPTTGKDGHVTSSTVLSLIARGEYHYARSSTHRRDDDILVWAFVLVVKAGFVLSYRHGSYREERDSFRQKRTLGFYTPVAHQDTGLFDRHDHGIVASGLKAMATDLALSYQQLRHPLEESSTLQFFTIPDPQEPRDLLSVITFLCPEWLEPTRTRLAMNDLRWLDLGAMNHLEDFDPWSRSIFDEVKRLAHSSRTG